MNDATATADEVGRERWSPEAARAWYSGQGAIKGCNYLPRTAVNSTEMWQAETFDPRTIAQELRWAKSAGLTSVRVFLQFIVWEADPEGLKSRFSRFMDLAGAEGLSVMPVLFCDCSFSGREPYLGRQAEPVPGVHNSGWVPSPGLGLVDDKGSWERLRAYVDDMVGSFGDDRRVVAWDLYNEPGNSGMGARSLPLVEAAFAWARQARPQQPLTVAAWEGSLDSAMSLRLMALSDVVSFHGYSSPEVLAEQIAELQRHGRPVLCTEWLHRQSGNTVQSVLPIWEEHKVGWYLWGLVAGRTQTYYHWGSAPGSPSPTVWQHDLLHADGTPYAPEEIRLLQD